MSRVILRPYSAAILSDGASSELLKTTPTGLNTGANSLSFVTWIEPRTAILSTYADLLAPVMGRRFCLGDGGGGVYFFFSDGINSNNNISITAAQYFASFGPQRRVRVAWVITSTTASLYANGVLVKTQSLGTTMASGTYSKLTLLRNGTGTQQVTGPVNDAYFVNGAMTAQEVADDFFNATYPSGLASAWLMNEGGGANIIDRVGSNNLAATSITWVSNVPLKARVRYEENLLRNGDCEIAPPFVAATTVNERFIDGTASGSTTNDTNAWKLASTSLSGTVTSISARFKSVFGKNAIEVSTVGGMKKAGSTVTGLGIFQTSYSGATLTEADRPRMYKVLPNTTYIVSMDYFTTQIDAGVFPSLAAVEYDGSLARGVTTSGAGATDVSVDWRTRTFTFTTASTARYVNLSARCQAGGGVDFDNGNCTIAFRNITIAPYIPAPRPLYNANLVKNGDFEAYPSPLTAPTGTTSRYVDGTSGGSTTRGEFGVSATIDAGTVTVGFDTAVFHSGTASIKVDVTDAAGRGRACIGSRTGTGTSLLVSELRQYAVQVLPNTAYNLDYWIKTLNIFGGTGAKIAIHEHDGAGVRNTSYSAPGVTGTADWAAKTLAFTTQASTAFLVLSCEIVTAGGAQTAWFDDISIFPATPYVRAQASVRSAA